ncbi:MAG: multicopper oxidase domain-containing protein [Xanthomonadales bacterium]|nr:multicopper oxidase domain-containing protein [Xanthomonadales bacterium]
MGLNHGASRDGGRIEVLAPLGATETWRFINRGNQPHPMHLHGSRFRVTARSGPPLATDAGWKDTVLVRVGETVDVRLSFEVPGLFVLHCHNLEHEDEGMMQNFVVGDGLFADGFESGG